LFNFHTFNVYALIFWASTALAAGTRVILPLYSWAGNPEWAVVASSLAEYPSIDFLIIINPSSGPGSSSPDSVWTNAITKLKSYSNAQIIGYVRTSYGGRDSSEIESEVSEYAAWPEAARVSGIFFDEVSANNVPYYTTLADFVESKFSDGVVVLNPGAGCTTGYFEVAEQVIVYENSFANYHFNNTELEGVSHAHLQSVIIHSMPTDIDALSTLVTSLVSAGFGSVYLTEDPATYQNLGTDWDSFLSLMHIAVGSSSGSSGSAVVATSTRLGASTVLPPGKTPAPSSDRSPPTTSSVTPSSTSTASTTSYTGHKHKHGHKHKPHHGVHRHRPQLQWDCQ
jgi:hypothetical protein